MNEEEKKKRIVDLFKENSEPDPPRPSSSHSAVGHGNIQISDVSGHVTVVQSPALDPKNPGLIPCPICSRLVSHTADECPDCYDNLAARRGYARHQAINRRKFKFSAACMAIAALAWGAGQLLPSYSGFSAVVATLSLLAAMSVMK